MQTVAYAETEGQWEAISYVAVSVPPSSKRAPSFSSLPRST